MTQKASKEAPKQPEPAKKESPRQATDKTRPGGYYIVNGQAVDANGNPIKEDQDEQSDSGSTGQAS